MTPREEGKIALSGLGRVLVNNQLLNEQEAQQADTAARADHENLIVYLVKNKILPADRIAHRLANSFGLPLFDLDSIDKEMIPQKVVSEKLIQRHHALPIFKRGTQLFLAISDPMNQAALDEIKFNTGLNTFGILVEENKLTEHIDDSMSQEDTLTSLGDLSDADLEELEINNGETEKTSEEEDDGGDDAPIVRFVNKVLLDAIKCGASDIHFEPFEKSYRVRLRQDGILRTVASPPASLSARIASRLKVMSELDISERRVPQDGRFKMQLSKRRSIDFRISTCPTVGGEKVVMRILDPNSASLGIDSLGYFKEQKELFLEAIHRPQGMVLVTGPTGSGKTVSLYTALNILNTVERNISTAEDPVEIHLEGVNQVQINPKTGMVFSEALKSFLRQDPDIIMVGEIRDLETAEIAIKAAQTGHLVLSTLHTNSAPETLSRLANMGVAPFNIATAASLVIAQRLARRLCPHCKRVDHVPREALLNAGFALKDIEDIKIYAPVGCDHCVHGYKGRLGLYEVLKISPMISDIIMRGGNALDISKQAKQEGMLTLRDSALIRVREGITSLAEVNRVTKDNE